ncbi:MAG: HD-GYP domain-containing protein [Gammaproteobacteria bacterium]
MNDDSQRPLILVVDDIPQNIDVLAGILRDDYDLIVALDGGKALELAGRQRRPDMILLDIMMPGIDGYEVCRRLKADPLTSEIPVIFITAKNETADEAQGFDLGAVDYITKPVSPPIVRARVRTHLAMASQHWELTRRVAERTRELNESRLQIIRHLGRAAEYKDDETGKHVIRMSHYARLIARAYGANETWVEDLFNVAPMHDIGKIGIPDRILRKPGKLDAEEWEIMKRHPDFGAAIFGDDPSPTLRMARSVALTHHERWDGTGYPKGLKGEEIPLEGRIVALADVFDALVSERPYKKALPLEHALRLIDEGSGSHFDPALVPLLHQVLPEILEIKRAYDD